jgi:hypothetical protein
MTKFEIFAVVWPVIVGLLVMIVGVVSVLVSERIDDRRKARLASGK